MEVCAANHVVETALGDVTPEEIAIPSIRRIPGVKTAELVRRIHAAVKANAPNLARTTGDQSMLTDVTSQENWPMLDIFHVFSSSLDWPVRRLRADERPITSTTGIWQAIRSAMESLHIATFKIQVQPDEFGWGICSAHYSVFAPEDLTPVGFRKFIVEDP